ncbi:MAG: magnesium transporter [Clostridiales bacterium]|nr:magnesium transporter [Clostridiales bacterium]MBR5057974.1 magnesium transporter [Clostridiales bacterium]
MDYENETRNETRNVVEEIVALIRSEKSDGEIRAKLEDYHESDLADALEQITKEERKKVYHILGAEKASEVFAYLEEPEEFISELDIQSAAKIIENMDADDAVDVLEEVDEETQEKIISLMDDESSQDIKLIQSYEDDEIGSKMTTNFVVVKDDLTIKQAMKELIRQADENDNISTIYVTDKEDKFYGVIDLKDLIRARDYAKLESLIVTSYPYVHDHEKIDTSIEKIKDYAEDSIPVLNDNDEILGVITSQDIIEVVDDEMGDDYAKLAGLTAEEDLKETLPESMKKRLPWLVTLLVLGLFVSTVVGLFETVVSELAIVVCFQSLILDMAGNVGTQSLAVTIRVLMDEHLKTSEKFKFALKEMRVGFCNGMLLGAMAFAGIGFYVATFKHYPIGFSFAVAACVGGSLWLAMIVSSLVGTLVPMFFHKIKVDPAVASGPLITTVNDLVAVVTYYGCAWIFLINLFHTVA